MTPLSALDRLAVAVPAMLKTRGAALAVVALLQLGILGVMLGERVHLLTTGREIVLKTEPVDPRDFFKGDFARLRYDVSTVPYDAGLSVSNGVAAPLKLPAGSAAFVTLAQAADGRWQVAKITARYPTAVAANEVVLSARPGLGSSWPGWPQQVRYGIERYYVPEGTGHDIEKLAREHRLEVIVAVGGKGQAAIKGLAIDGKRVYDEPLF